MEPMTKTALIGLAKKIIGEPCDMMRLWRKADSAISPRTKARTMGAIG
jgi:hypothetical protein